MLFQRKHWKDLTGANWLNFTNFFVEKSDFLKIRNIGIAYDYKPKKYLKSVKLAFNVYNPFAFTASSVDPEAALAGAVRKVQ